MASEIFKKLGEIDSLCAIVLISRWLSFKQFKTVKLSAENLRLFQNENSLQTTNCFALRMTRASSQNVDKFLLNS